jgi:hypothetical protein
VKALSIRAPWWWFILHGGKDIENRDWSTNFRGTIYLHVGKWWNTEAVCEDWDSMAGIAKPDGTPLPAGRMNEYCGCIVGTVDIVDCVTDSGSPWFFGKFGFVLANPVAFDKPIPCKGALGFFNPEVQP